MTISTVAPEGFATDVTTTAQLGDTGIVFGQTDTAGVKWEWSTDNAWGPKPAPREQVGDRAFDDGQWDATRYYGPRVFELKGTCRAPDHAALHWAEQRLRNAIGITPVQLRIIEPGFDGHAMVRQQGQVLWSEINRTTASFSITLFAADPLVYSANLRSFDLYFPVSSGGLIWPVTWPATWTGTTVSGSVILNNPSDREIPLQLVATGPVNHLRIANAMTGDALVVNNPLGDTLTAGQFFTIDTARHQLLLLGTASRRGWASGQWPMLAPGDNTIAISGDATTSASHVAGTYRSVRL